MLHQSIFRLAGLLCLTGLFLAISPPIFAADPDDTLEKLRTDYAEARDAAAKTERPKRGAADFRVKLKVWSDAVRKKRDAAHSLVPVLFERWIALSADSGELPAIHNEIKAVYQEMAGKPLTQGNSDAKSFFADAVWPLLVNEKLTPDRAAFLVEITKPHPGVRINDKIAQLGNPTEPLDWNIQDAHSLALLRAGRIDDARRENVMLLQKVTLNLDRGRVPNVKVNYRNGKRTNQSLRREYLLHSALIEAVSGNKQKTQERLAEVKQIEEDKEIAARQVPLFREIETRIEP